MTARISIAIVFCAARAVLGQTSGAEFQVNTVTTGDQSYPAACRDPNGRAVVTWETRDPTGSKTDVRARRYDATGAPLGDAELAVNAYTADDQQLPSPACRADGSFIVVWESRTQDGDDFGIVDQRFDANGTRLGDETIVNSHTAGRQRNPALCNDAAGNFVVVWQSLDQDGDGYGVFGQRFDAAGGRRSGEFQVNTFSDHSQWHPAIACSAAGEFVVAWESGRQDGDGYGIFAQRFAADGGRLGDELRRQYDHRRHATAARGRSGTPPVTSSSPGRAPTVRTATAPASLPSASPAPACRAAASFKSTPTPPTAKKSRRSAWQPTAIHRALVEPARR